LIFGSSLTCGGLLPFLFPVFPWRGVFFNIGFLR
jgi:hypothetical protein